MRKWITVINANDRYQDYLTVLQRSMKECAPKEKLESHVMNIDRIAASHVRFWLMLEALEEGYDQVGWIDADTIVRMPLGEFWGNIGPRTIKITVRPWQDVDKRKFQTGVFAVGNSDPIKEILAKVDKKCRKHHKWYADQLYFYRCCLKRKNDIELLNLDRKWNDNRMGEDSAIWHCHMKKKDSNEDFNALSRTYLCQ